MNELNISKVFENTFMNQLRVCLVTSISEERVLRECVHDQNADPMNEMSSAVVQLWLIPSEFNHPEVRGITLGTS